MYTVRQSAVFVSSIRDKTEIFERKSHSLSVGFQDPAQGWDKVSAFSIN